MSLKEKRVAKKMKQGGAGAMDGGVAAEAAVGLGILIAFFRNKETVNIDEVNLLKW